ncbi:cell envelope integrity protein TolA [Vibrio zhugei]|uniref:Cell envelope integrity protein TolA n=1 Tax=Vibrio zhugei TaxID=2479546 RepID=A0ABV7CEL7_9VIBR|nr:cell envelope integrity protein TolA [Vibrio zhugei]
MRSKNQEKPQFTAPVIISIALHAVLIGALVWSADFNLEKPKPKSSGKMVEAVVVDPNLIHQQAEKIRQQRAEAAQKEQARKARLDKMRREADELAKKRKAEEESIRKLKEQQALEAKKAREAEKARQERAAQEKKAAAEKARQEKERAAKAEAKRKAEAAAAKAKAEKEAKARAEREKAEKAKQAAAAAKAKQERLAKEKAAKEKAAKEAAAKAKAKAQQQKQLEDIFNGLKNESSENSAAQAKHVASESDRWGAIYQQLIQKNLLLDDNFKGKDCKVNLRLIPTGTGAILKNITVEGGDSRLCRATRAAVAKVGTFPLPKNDPAVVEKLRNINLTVAPE